MLGPHLDDGSRERAQATEIDEAELLAAGIEEWCGDAGARRRRSVSASLAARALLLLLRSERQGGGEVKWQSGVACARSDRFEGRAWLVGAGTAPRRRCTGAAWRPGRRGRRAREPPRRGPGPAKRCWPGRNAQQAGTQARPASAVGREAERRPVKRNEILFFLFFFKKCLNASFQTLF